MYSYTFANLLGASVGNRSPRICFDRYARCLYTPTSNRVASYRLHHSAPGVAEAAIAGASAAATASGTRRVAADGNSNRAGRTTNSHEVDSDNEEEQRESAAEPVNTSQVQTLPFEARNDVQWFCLRSDGLLAISIDTGGQGLVVNILKGCIVNRLQFRGNTSVPQKKTWKALQQQHHPVSAAAFSPDDSLFAVALGRTLQIWKAPAASSCYQLVLLRCMTLHQQQIVSFCWSPDSTHAVTGSLDCTVRLWRVRKKRTLRHRHHHHHYHHQQQQYERQVQKQPTLRNITQRLADGEEKESTHRQRNGFNKKEEIERLLRGMQDVYGGHTSTAYVSTSNGDGGDLHQSREAFRQDSEELCSSSSHVGGDEREVELSRQDEEMKRKRRFMRKISRDVYNDAEATADEEFIPLAFVAHRHPLKFVCFSACLSRIISVNRNGGIVVWKWVPHADEVAAVLAAPGADTRVSFTEGRRKRKRKFQTQNRSNSERIRKKVGVARIIHPSARQKRARLRLLQEQQQHVGGAGGQKSRNGERYNDVYMEPANESLNSEGEKDDYEDDRHDEEEDREQETEEVQEEKEEGYDSRERSRSRSSRGRITVNYMRGAWKTESKAFCASAASAGHRIGDEVVTHAATNISPYYRNTTLYYSQPGSAGMVSSQPHATAASLQQRLPIGGSLGENATDFTTTTTMTTSLPNVSSYRDASYGAAASSSVSMVSSLSETASVNLPPQYLLVGLVGGVLQLYELPSLCALTRLCLGLPSVDAVAVSFDGEWLAAASTAAGGEGGRGRGGGAAADRLVVWEWRSETYVLQQQSGAYGVRCLAFSPAAAAAFANSGAAATGKRVGSSSGAAAAAVAAAVAACNSSKSFGMGLARGLIAAGGADGRVKVYDAESGFCCCCFARHAAAVTAVAFSPAGNALFSASLDGTVRAFDLLRFRQFRVFVATPGHAEAGFSTSGKQKSVSEGEKEGGGGGRREGAAIGSRAEGEEGDAAACLQELPPMSVQFSCLAVDAAGELLVAGGSGSCFTAYVWSIQTGRVIDELGGHEAAVAAVAFHPHPLKQGLVVTASADKRIQVWDLYARRSHGGAPETFRCETEVRCVALEQQAGVLLAAGCAAGKLLLFDISLGSEEGLISSWDIIREIQRGRRAIGDRRACNNWAPIAKKRLLGMTAGVDLNAAVDSVAFSSSGALLLACSSNCVKTLLFDVKSGCCIARYCLTHSRFFEGVLRELSSSHITDAGDPLQEYDISDEDEYAGASDILRQKQRIRKHEALPGVRSGPLSSKNTRIFIVHQVSFSPDSRSWAAATSQGLYIYSMDYKNGMYGTFGAAALACAPPPLLTKKVTLSSIAQAVEKNEYAKAMIFSLVINDQPTLLSVYERIPPAAIPAVCCSLAPALLPSLLFFLHVVLSTDVNVGTPHLQLHLIWLLNIITLNLHVFQGDVSTLFWAESGGGGDPGATASHSSCTSRTTEISKLNGSKMTERRNQQNANSTGADEAFNRLTRTPVEMRTLFLLILRQLQQQYANLHATYSSNIATLAVVQAAVLQRPRFIHHLHHHHTDATTAAVKTDSRID